MTEDILTVNFAWRVSYCKLKAAISDNCKFRVQRKMDKEKSSFKKGSVNCFQNVMQKV